ncbi:MULTISPECIES: hypothetical protein [Streptomyces]|uniref:Uncharacterized protein n=1 Tax=Streptomyces chartreusis NRRL 3882 TaxID=1079985 RepID=A0A2N9BLH1_STRCX|nr:MULTISPECIES: hypothetical protein [Streptomyces]SOR84220.1 hypothetical protein SCNRRL3882_7665 [Streptomyces chartreusis NRRL 3882]
MTDFPPHGLPVPGRFAHLHPDDGACLMESAALLAGGGFTDSPAGTHPALAALVRVVNDSVGDATRHALWPLAAELADARPVDRAYAPLLVGTVVGAARVLRWPSRRLARHGRACRRRGERLAHVRAGGLPGRVADLLWWRGPGRRYLEHALRVLCAAPDADERLAGLLRKAVAEARDAAGGGAARGGAAGEGRVPAGEGRCNR